MLSALSYSLAGLFSIRDPLYLTRHWEVSPRWVQETECCDSAFLSCHRLGPAYWTNSLCFRPGAFGTLPHAKYSSQKERLARGSKQVQTGLFNLACKHSWGQCTRAREEAVIRTSTLGPYCPVPLRSATGVSRGEVLCPPAVRGTWGERCSWVSMHTLFLNISIDMPWGPYMEWLSKCWVFGDCLVMSEDQLFVKSCVILVLRRLDFRNLES